jgi:hypothetical protein
MDNEKGKAERHFNDEVGALLDRERFMSNITDDMRLRLKHNVAALNWTFHSTSASLGGVGGLWVCPKI